MGGMNGRCPGACIYNDCENNCGGQDIDGDGSHGLCDRLSGVCMCTGGVGSPGNGAPDYNYNGPACRKVTKGADANRDEQHAVWTTSMDQWGWSTCKTGYLMVGMQTDLLSSMDALYNLDRAKCQRPYEAGEVMPSAVEPSRCYHENWWKQMDSKGGKFCRRNYFIAGFFRSHCNSLYCIEMAKCCSVKRSIWKDCSWTNVVREAGSTPVLRLILPAQPSSPCLLPSPINLMSESSAKSNTHWRVSPIFVSAALCGGASSGRTRCARTMLLLVRKRAGWNAHCRAWAHGTARR